MPAENSTTIRAQIGKSTTAMPGLTPKMTSSTIMKTVVTRKSTIEEQAVANGTSMRGKNTLDTRSRLDTSDWEARLIMSLNKLYGSSPENTTSRYGTPPLGRWATWPSTRVNTRAVSRGWRTTQTTPSNVWR